MIWLDGITDLMDVSLSELQDQDTRKLEDEVLGRDTRALTVLLKGPKPQSRPTELIVYQHFLKGKHIIQVVQKVM